VSLGRLRNAQGSAKDAVEHYRNAADCYRKAGMKDEADRALGLIRNDGK